MEVNLNKTEIIVFRNGGNLRNSEKWYFDGAPVNVVYHAMSRLKDI